MTRSKFHDELALMMSSATNRRVMWQLLGKCGVMATTFARDPALTAFNEGRRAVGIELWADLELASVEHLLTMQREAMERKNDDRSNTREPADRRIQSSLGLDAGGTGNRDRGEDGSLDSAGWFSGPDPALDD